MAEILPVTDRFLPYVLEMVMSDAEEDGKSLAVILVVVKKASGVLLAVPANYFDEEILEGGQDAGPDELIGPSTTIRVPGGRLEQMNGPPPIAVPGAMVDLVLIDMHPDVLSQLVLVSEYDGPTELLHLFDEDPFVYPLRDELVAMTWDWIVQPTAGERVSLLLCSRGRSGGAGVGPRDGRWRAAGAHSAWSKSCRFAYRIRKDFKGSGTSKDKEADSGFSGKFLRVGDGGDPGPNESIGRAEPKNQDHGGEDAGATQVVSIESATWWLRYDWIVREGRSQGVNSFEGDASSTEHLEVEAGEDWRRSGGCRDLGTCRGERDRGWGHRDGACNVCPVHGYNCVGCADCKYERRPHRGVGKLLIWFLQQRCDRKDEVAAGTRCSEGHILQRCDGEHGEADDACNDYGGDTYADGRPGLDNDEVRREVRRLWACPGFWACDVAGGNDHGPPSDGELAGCKGRDSSSVSLSGANSTRRDDGCRPFALIERRPHLLECSRTGA